MTSEELKAETRRRAEIMLAWADGDMFNRAATGDEIADAIDRGEWRKYLGETK